MPKFENLQPALTASKARKRISEENLAKHSGILLSSVINILYGNINNCAFDDIVKVAGFLGVDMLPFMESHSDDQSDINDIIPLHFQEIDLIKSLRVIDEYSRDIIRDLVNNLAQAQLANSFFDGTMGKENQPEKRESVTIIDFGTKKDEN